jgi:MFS family permease
MNSCPSLLERESVKTPPGKWQVGSLTYTNGPLAVLFSWLLWGDFAWNMRDRAIPPIMQLLFKNFGASDMFTGVLLSSLPAALSLFIAPVIGYNSDRWRSRWGRRIPFLIFPIPLIVLALGGLVFSPWLGNLASHVAQLQSLGAGLLSLAFLAFFWTLFEAGCVTTNGVYGGLVNDVVPQKIVGRFFGLCRVLGLIAGIIFNYWLMGRAGTDYPWIFLIVGVLYGIGFVAMCLKVREGNYPPPPEAPRGSRWATVQTYFQETFTRPYYLWTFAASILAGLAFAPINLYSVTYARQAGLGMNIYGECLAVTYVISLLLAYPIGMLADRFHPLRVSIVFIGFYALIMLAGSLLVHDATSFKFALVAHGVGVGSYATASCSLGQRLLPASKFAEIGSAGGIISSLVSIFFAPMVGLILDQTHHHYHNLFFMGFAIALLALITNLVLLRKFYALGGPENYVAPV